MTYTITLEDPPAELNNTRRAEAVRRFQGTLERALNGPEGVLAAYRAWQTAEDLPEGEMSAEDVMLAKRWIAAATRARTDGLREVGEDEQAYFELRLAR
ncbi:MAG: hypothetical protein M0R28_10045 [Pigmentiphaga sp.]|nr:hypothetical protein [Pigmentiphaga sp.]